MKKLVISAVDHLESLVDFTQEELDLHIQQLGQSQLDALIPSQEEVLSAQMELQIINTLIELGVI